MPEGNVRISLVQPGPVEINAAGSQVQTPPTVYDAWALRTDGGGSKSLEDDTVSSERNVSFEIRKQKRLAKLSPSWFIIDKAGSVFDIVAVREVPMNMGRTFVRVECDVTDRFAVPVDQRLGTEIVVDGMELTVNGNTVVIARPS